MTDRVGLPPLAAEDHACPSCELRYDDVDMATIADRTRATIAELRGLVTGLSRDQLTRRPDDGSWTALEYLCHVRDVYVSATIRLYRVRTETGPQVEPLFNDLRAIRFRYNTADAEAVLAETDAAVEGFVDEITRVQDWDRVLTRLPGEDRTARWLARQALHEGVHHVGDIRHLGTAP